jgi:hypothetical protein
MNFLTHSIILMQGRFANRPDAFAFLARPVFAAAVFFRAPPAFALRFGAALALAFGFGLAPRGRFGPPPPGRVDAPPGSDVAGSLAAMCTGRSETCTVKCAVRFTMRNARPIGAGRIRFCDGPWFA